MDAERWSQIATLYQAALERAPDERAVYLDSACRGDDDLRREVESLLAQVGKAALIDAPVWTVAASVLDDNPGVQQGTRIGSYEVDVLIGAGGMGQVYRAHDTTLHRDVALKVLPPAFTSDTDRLARFRREAQILASLNHPHIAAVYGFETSGSIHALVLELVDGPTLADRIAQGPLPLDEALPIARQLADALEAAHERGVVHRDLKPANIKLRTDGTVKVLDFGLSKALEPGTTAHVEGSRAAVTASPTVMSPVVTGAGTILGTAAYMAPEQAKGKSADRRSDIWAFGCVFYEMLTGRRPFDGEDVSDTLAHVLRGDPDWTALPPAVPDAITHLIKRCLEKQPRDRISHIAVAAFAIDESVREPARTRSTGQTDATRRRRRAWIAAAILLAVSSALVLLWLTRRQPEREQLRLELITPASVSPNSFELAPDGRTIAFVADDAGKSRLWIRALDSGSLRPFAGTEDARFPFWSSDSRSIAFFADEQLKVLNVGNRTVRALATAPAPQGGAWNREGVIVFAPSTSRGLWRISAEGGTPAPVTEPAAGQGNHAFPKFLPDGRRFLYQVGGTPDASGVYVGSLDSSDTKRIAYLGGSGGGFDSVSERLLFVREGALLAQPFDVRRLELTGTPAVVAEGVNAQSLSVSATGMLAYRQRSAPPEYRFVWVDRAGTELQRIGEPSRAAGDFSFSGERLAFSAPVTVPGNQDVWVLDIERGTRERLTTSPAFDGNPLWSPAADRIVFTRGPVRGTTELVLRRKPSVESDEEVLLTGRRAPMATDWSRDGRFLLYKQRSSDEPTSPATSQGQLRWEIWAMRTDGDRTSFPVVRNSFDNHDAQFSPDGKWIAYHSNETGAFEIYVQPFPSGARQRISTAGGAQARWRSDGKELFYVALDGSLMAVPIRLESVGTTIQVGTPVRLFQTRLAGGVTQPLNRQQYTPSADGARFLLHTITGELPNPPITVIVNFNTRTQQ